jgi:hypothetical protein
VRDRHSSYRLAPHVRAASDPDGVVLLDLRSGRYLALNPAGSAVLDGVRVGLTTQGISERVAAQCEAPLDLVARDAERFLAQLVSSGLIDEGTLPHGEISQAPDGPPLSTPSLPPALPAGRALLWIAPAYLGLIVVDLALRLRGFGRVHRWLHRLPAGGPGPGLARARRLACAVDLAAAYYPKRAWCLERSLVTLLLMRMRRWPARLVLGAKRMPFAAHAWVEMDGQVVNDDTRVRARYAVLERC